MFREYRIITMPISSHLLMKKFPLTFLFIVVPDQIIVAAKVTKSHRHISLYNPRKQGHHMPMYSLYPFCYFSMRVLG